MQKWLLLHRKSRGYQLEEHSVICEGFKHITFIKIQVIEIKEHLIKTTPLDQ